MLKFELTDDTIQVGEATLHRIKATSEGPWGPVGTLGGYVETEQNLAQRGDCWVGDEAKVYGNSQISGWSRVSADWVE